MSLLARSASEWIKHAVTLSHCQFAYALLTTLAFVSTAHAVPLDSIPIGTTHLNIEDETFVGTGAATTYFVVDFTVVNGNSFAFGYHHDGFATAQDMFNDFEAAGILNHFVEVFGFGDALRGIEYPREQQQDIFPNAFGNERSWVLWQGEYIDDQILWSGSPVGINGVEFGNVEPTVFLPDGGFYAVTTSPEFPGREPIVPIPGDFDSDGVVDGDDMLDLLLGFGTSNGPTLRAGDADRDGDVDRGDVTLLLNNLGADVTPTPIANAVPEPATWLLLSLTFWCGRKAIHSASAKAYRCSSPRM